MSSAMLALCVVTALIAVSQGEPPLNIGLGDLSVHGDGDVGGGGYGGGASLDSGYGVPAGGYSGGGSDFGSSFGGGDYSSKGEIVATQSAKGVRYAGPIVYTNEKPPIIHFPPPPKPKKGGGYGKGSGKGGKGHSIKYVPLPHHDLPILIYQSDIKPPIHVVHPPAGSDYASVQPAYGAPKVVTKGSDYSVDYSSSSSKGEFSAPSSDYGAPSGDYGAPSQVSYGAPQASYGAPQVSYGAPQASYGAPQASYGAPANEYAAPSSSYGSPASDYGAPSGDYGAPSAVTTEYGPPKGEYGPPVNVEYGPPKAEYGPPKAKAQQLPHIIYTGHPPIHIFQQPPIYMSAPKASYGPPAHKSNIAKSQGKAHYSGAKYSPPKGEYGPPSKGSKGESDHGSGGGYFSKGFASSFSSHFSFPKASFSLSLPRFKYGSSGHGSKSSSKYNGGSSSGKGGYGGGGKGSSKGYSSGGGGYSSGSGSKYSGSSKSSNYVLAPKGFSKPPIIIYQGSRPPVHVFEAPSGGYSETSIVSAPTGIVSHTHPVAPLDMQAEYSQNHAHVAGTGAPGNPVAGSIDLTYGVSRVSSDAIRYVETAQQGQQQQQLQQQRPGARTIWLQQGNGQQVQIQQVPQQAHFYVGGQQQQQQPQQQQQQQFKILRRSDLDEAILSNVQYLTTNHANQQQLVQGHQFQARIDALPQYISSTNQNSGGKVIPASYQSVIVQAAASSRSGEPASIVESSEPIYVQAVPLASEEKKEEKKDKS